WMATRPAAFAGLAQRKGRIAPGFDADLTVFDADSSYVIKPDMIKYRHKITPYESKQVTGVVEKTYLRGQQVYVDGELPGKPVGQAILRSQ
ncbi:MAG: amidohydrolase family protein, partial [Pseudomonadales bacterium]